jgi:carboxyl-terminal processing protease
MVRTGSNQVGRDSVEPPSRSVGRLPSLYRQSRSQRKHLSTRSDENGSRDFRPTLGTVMALVPLAKKTLLLTLLFGLFPISFLHAIECHELELVTEKMLREHYVYRQFDEALSQRVSDQVLSEIDPGKLIFEKSDVEQLKKQYGNDLDIWLFARSCDFLEAIQELFYRRSQERHPHVTQQIGLIHDFTIDESYLRPKSRDYLNRGVSLDDRWRRQIKYQILQSRLTGLTEEAILGKLKRYYEKRLIEKDRLTDLQLRDHFLKAFARSLDPHSKYYPPANAADIRIALGETFFGIGATIETRNESFFISRLNPGGPAFLGKQLQPGDQILAVGDAKGEPVEAFGKTLTELVHLIRGPKDSQVEITVHRQNEDGNQVKKIPIIRDRIDPVAAATEKQVFDLSTTSDSSVRIGVIALSSFYLDRNAQQRRDTDYRSATRDVEKLIKQLQEDQIDSLILDLRGNGGGILSEAVSITGLFIDSGPVVQKRDAFGDVVVLRDKDQRIVYEGPLTVIIEGASASASEIVAGALQDYRRALVIGNANTFGKGTVQIVTTVDRRRDELGSFKLTNALYFLPSGRTPQLEGIAPHIVLPQSNRASRSMRDRPFAIPSEKLPPIEYTKTTEGNHHIAPLQARSQRRTNDQPTASPTTEDDQDKVSLLESTYNGSENQPPSIDSETILNESLRITYDRYHLLKHLPLNNAPIEIVPVP